MNRGRLFEFRCPVHGFIQLDEWERDIIAMPAFQRLRRIRQLAWTDYIYPGAMHTRFEHSLGVMHIATRLYDAVWEHSREMLESSMGYDEAGRLRFRKLVRLAALLHDVGHGPFSHAAEDLMPLQADGKTRYEHDIHYSSAVIRTEFMDVIENHAANANFAFRADDIATLIEGSSKARGAVFWRELITGQMDADRMDYLLRDSLHTGVQYGRYDLERLVHTIVAIPMEQQAPRLGVSEGGLHAAESLIIARYFMFTQVYLHRTRLAYDHHVQMAMSNFLPGGLFPSPDKDSLKEYLLWDDWRVLGLLASGEGGEHAKRITERNHYREVYHTPEVPGLDAEVSLDKAREVLGKLLVYEHSPEKSKSWYKFEGDDIPVHTENPARRVVPLSDLSSVVKGMKPIRQTLLYVKPEHAENARNKIKRLK